MFCPNINNKKVKEDFNKVVTKFGGKPMTTAEFKSVAVRNKRVGVDKVAIDHTYYLWDKFNGEIPQGTAEQLENIIVNPAKIEQEETYFDAYTELEDDVVVPNYESAILHKEYLVRQLEKRVEKIKADKKKYSSNTAKLKALNKEQAELTKRLEGDVIEGTSGLIQDIAALKEAPALEKFNFYVEKEFEYLAKLVESDRTEDLKEAKSIIDFYTKLGTFDSSLDHPLFPNENIYTPKGEVILDSKVVDYFKSVADRAVKANNRLFIKEKQVTTEALNSNLSEKGFDTKTYKELFTSEKGLKDASWIDMYVMDTTNGIFSHNGIIPGVMSKILEDSFEKHLVYAKDVENRISLLQEDVEKELTAMGYGIKIPGIKGVSYDLFRAKDSNGLFKDGIIQRFSPKFTDARGRMLSDFDRQIKKAQELTDPKKKAKAYKAAHRFKEDWYKKNTIVLDLRKLPEVVNDPAFSEFNQHFISDETDAYKKQIVGLLGEKGYQEEVAKQVKLLKDYLSMREVYKESVQTESNPDKKMDLWVKRNNPFIFMKHYISGVNVVQGNNIIDPFMTYNYAVPRKKVVKAKVTETGLSYIKTNQDTGFYEDRFSQIEDSEVLKEFHNLLVEVQSTIYDIMPPEVRRSFYAYALPVADKSIFELLADKNIPFLRKVSKSATTLYDKIRLLFGQSIQSSYSYATINEQTGKPDYQVNTQFLKSNKKEIEDRYFAELQKAKKLLGIKLTAKISKYDSFDVTTNEFLRVHLASQLGLKEHTVEALQKRLPEENLEALPVAKILKDAVTHQVVMSKSFDLPKILKLYSYLTMEYAARQEVLPTLNMIKNHYEEIKNPRTTAQGSPMTNFFSGKTAFDGVRTNANRQMESWFKRAVLGDYTSKSEFGNTAIKRVSRLGVTGLSPVDKLNKKLKTTVTGKIYTQEEKNLREELKKIADDLTEIAKNSGNEDEIEAANKMLVRIHKILSSTGKDFTVASFFDAIFNFIRFVGLGWNLSSSVTNYLEGQVANLIVAASGDYFTPENIYRANHIVKGSFFKNLTASKFSTKGAKLTSILMARYRILQDASNELQKASAKSAFSSFRALSPYELTRRTEYLNQAPLMLSILLDQEITGKDGTTSNVIDAMNSDGTLKENFATEENIKNWEQADGQSYNNFKTLIGKVIVNTHGDYHELKGNMATEYITGKALLMFKRWMSRQFYQRFAVMQSDVEAGIKDYKGRYYSHTQASGLLHGGMIGFAGLSLMSAGLPGLLIGGGIGLVLGRFYGANTGLNFVQDLAFTTKNLFLTMLKIPINNIAGMSIIPEGDFKAVSDQNAISSRDLKNFKANMVEMSLLLAWIGFTLFSKALLWDDEDDDEDVTRIAHNLFVNRFMQLSSQASMYADPAQVFKNTLGSMAVIRFLDNVRKTGLEFYDYLEGKDTIPTGVNAGESALYNQFSKTFMPSVTRGFGTSTNPFTGFGWLDQQSENLLGFGTQAQRQFQKTPYDDWFENAEVAAQAEIRRRKAKDKKKYSEKLNKSQQKTLQKELNKHYTKKKSETYQDVLDRINSESFTSEVAK